MTRFADGPIVEVATHVAASPAELWPFIIDINLPASFQDEFIGAEWLDDGPALGARFLGRNQRGGRTWDTTSWVVDFEPEQRFGWAVSDRDNPGATWTFRLEPQAGGTRLVFHRRLGPGPSGILHMITEEPEREEEIIARRDEMQRDHMQSVIEGIRRLAES